MFKMLFAAVAGSLIALLMFGYFTGNPGLPGMGWFKKLWPSTPKTVAKNTPEMVALWHSQPKVVNGEIEVTGWGAASPRESQGRSHAVALALRTARHSAYEQLAEFLAGARATSQSHYHGDMLEQAMLTTKTSAVIRGAKVVREDVKTLSDGTVRATVTLRHRAPKKTGA